MEDTKVKDTPSSREEKLRCFVDNATEVLKDESDDEIVRVFHQIQENLGRKKAKVDVEKSLLQPFNNTASCCGMPAIKVPVASLKRANGIRNRLDHEAHPMNIDLILKKVFEYCSVNTLMNCRLVCTKWLSVSLKSWRRNAILFTDNLIGLGVVEDVIKDGSEFRKTPFERYNILDYGGARPHFDLKHSILDTFSSSIQYLDLDCDDCELVMFLILTKLPRLRHAKLRFFYDDFLRQWQSRSSESRECPFQHIQPSPSPTLTKLQLNFGVVQIEPDQLEREMIPWGKFFEILPTLEYLQVKYDLESGYSRSKRVHLKILWQILQAVHRAREIGKFTTLNLKELDIMLHANHSSISIPFPKKISDIIIKSKLPLERLHIDLGTNCNKSFIAKLLEKHGETLKYLRAISAPNKYYLKKELFLEPFLRNKVLLENLKELELLHGCVWAFHFLNSLTVPRLEVLRIEEMILKQHKRFQKLNWKSVDVNCREQHFKNLLEPLHFQSLKRFYYSGPRHFSPVELQLLSKAMPNVTDLRLPLSVKTFPVVCERWPRLFSLQVGQEFEGLYPLIDDYAITGLSPFKSNQPKPARFYNITDLKNLGSFALEGNSGASFSRRAVITDVSAVHGFLHLSKLAVLQIGVICKFSPDVMTTLASHVSDVRVNVGQFLEEENGKVNSTHSYSSDDESESESEYSDPDL